VCAATGGAWPICRFTTVLSAFAAPLPFFTNDIATETVAEAEAGTAKAATTTAAAAAATKNGERTADAAANGGCYRGGAKGGGGREVPSARQSNQHPWSFVSLHAVPCRCRVCWPKAATIAPPLA
jgi:hypothetical protein